MSHDPFASRVVRPLPLQSDTDFARAVRAASEQAEQRGTSVTLVSLRTQDVHSLHNLLSALASCTTAACAGEEHSAELLLVGEPAEHEQALLDAARWAHPLKVGTAQAPRDARTSETLRALARERMQGEGKSFADGEGVVLDRAMSSTYGLARSVAAGSINVLLLGETGTGKEVLARSIHRFSPRANRTFVALNCATFSETLLESELFGHEKGAFTGATQAKTGLLETATGGTVFLDEIGEMPASLQAKLLRVFEERCVRRVGSLKERPIDVRLVAATNRNPQAELLQGRFRADLYYRLNGVTLHLPPLRERLAEIEPLSVLFVERFAQSMGLPRAPRLSREALNLMLSYRWPGNVRELRNVIERAMLLSASGEIKAWHLGIEPVSEQAPERDDERELDSRVTALDSQLPREAVTPAGGMPCLEGAPSGAERIMDALNRCGGNQTRAARMLGVSRGTLIARIIQYGLPRPRGRASTQAASDAQSALGEVS